MTIKSILDSIYLLPAIVDHIDNPTKLTKDVINSAGITPAQLDELKQMPNLLNYHINIVKKDFAPDYNTLRKGLKEYHNLYLKFIFNRLSYIDRTWTVLDYGSGEGQLSDRFQDLNPDSEVYKLDKYLTPDKYNLNIDFEHNPAWYSDYIDKFDLVILSEVLHCKDMRGQHYLFNSSTKILKPEGVLIIVENIDECMAYRIAKIKGISTGFLDFKEVHRMSEYYPLKLKDFFIINQHIIYRYEKI